MRTSGPACRPSEDSTSVIGRSISLESCTCRGCTTSWNWWVYLDEGTTSNTDVLRMEGSVLFIEVSSFQGVLIRGVPAVLFIEVSSFQGVLIRGAPAVLFIEVSSFQGVLIRGVPAVLFIEVSSFQGVLIRGVPAVLFIEVSSFQGVLNTLGSVSLNTGTCMYNYSPAGLFPRLPHYLVVWCGVVALPRPGWSEPDEGLEVGPYIR